MELHPVPLYHDHWAGDELARDATHRYILVEMGFNLRLLAVPRTEGLLASGYDYAWCYPRDPAAVRRAVEAWDSDTQHEPTGWHKRPVNDLRRAPAPADTPYNRPRCEHGSYVHDGCRTYNCETTRIYRARHGLPPIEPRWEQA